MKRMSWRCLDGMESKAEHAGVADLIRKPPSALLGEKNSWQVGMIAEMCVTMESVACSSMQLGAW